MHVYAAKWHPVGHEKKEADWIWLALGIPRCTKPLSAMPSSKMTSSDWQHVSNSKRNEKSWFGNVSQLRLVCFNFPLSSTFHILPQGLARLQFSGPMEVPQLRCGFLTWESQKEKTTGGVQCHAMPCSLLGNNFAKWDGCLTSSICFRIPWRALHWQTSRTNLQTTSALDVQLYPAGPNPSVKAQSNLFAQIRAKNSC